jgi:acylpyruvate hydrolase
MKIFCIGRNYGEHVKELKNTLPDKPVVFMKPHTALLVNHAHFYYPEFSKNIHYEGEIVLRICKNGRSVQPEFAASYYDAVAIGIDFTARDIQDELKQKGLPWEIAKGFDRSAALSKFIPLDELPDPSNIRFQMHKNGAMVQDGQTSQQIFDFNTIICYLSQYFMLQKGDMVYTGTPAGVGPIAIGDLLEGYVEGKLMLKCKIK